MIVLILLLCCYTLEAQNLPKFSYQAVVRNAENELVTNSPVTVDISVFNHQNFAEEIYTETHNVTSNLNGLISLLIGEGQNPEGDLLQVAWNDAQIRTRITIGTYTVTDTKPITAIPYAYFAERVPLSAIEEHLGSTDLVAESDLMERLNHFATKDTLSYYLLAGDFQDSLQNMKDSLSEMKDSLEALRDSLTNLIRQSDLAAQLNLLSEQIRTLQNQSSTVDEYIVSSIPSNTYILSHVPNPNHVILLYINGVVISTRAVSISGQTLTYRPIYNENKQLLTGDRIQIHYIY